MPRLSRPVLRLTLSGTNGFREVCREPVAALRGKRSSIARLVEWRARARSGENSRTVPRSSSRSDWGVRWTNAVALGRRCRTRRVRRERRAAIETTARFGTGRLVWRKRWVMWIRQSVNGYCYRTRRHEVLSLQGYDVSSARGSSVQRTRAYGDGVSISSSVDWAFAGCA